MLRRTGNKTHLPGENATVAPRLGIDVQRVMSLRYLGISNSALKMQRIIEKISARLGITVKETMDIITQALKDPSYQEKIVEILGYDMLEEAEAICRSRESFLLQEEVIVKDSYVEHILPESTPVEVNKEDLVSTDAVGEDKKYFNYGTFNTVQSKVFSAAYKSDENMLVCAPTGAGKTDIALLAVLRALRKNTKVIYIVPMKALATEITSKYKRQLKSHRVIEYTGDTDIKREEVIESDVVISTPEKFDVATRKQYNAFRDEIGLVVIDEIHLLQDDRGPVIEAIVSRMFRYIELNQKPIRIVGLSATLPNYEDVAVFLRAGHTFNFDQSYRPVPLKISVVGMISKSKASAEEKLVKQRVEDYLSNGKQVLVFVHSRGETLRTAKLLMDEGSKTEVKTKVLTGILLSLARCKVGVHHAGLPREVRLCMEDGFKNGAINVLVTTSTLAWGVNLPAYAVIIKGTRFYDSEKGKFSDLSILDILQIFGRAGRPQFDRRGEACLITTGNKVEHYLNLLKNNKQVESRLLQHVADIVNAEVYLNTITDISTAMSWLKSTFMYVRMLINPLNYGLGREELRYEDKVLSDYIVLTCNRLEESGMVKIYKPSPGNHNTWKFCSTEYGRIASMYYLCHETMMQWLENLDLVRDEDSVLELCLLSKDFTALAWREEDEEAISEICEELRLEYQPSIECKLITLTKAYIQGHPVTKFSLSCDTSYIVKNLKRVLAALSQILQIQNNFELVRTCCILLKRVERQKKVPWSPSNEVTISLSRAITMVKIGISSKLNIGYWVFVYADNSIIHADIFNQNFYSFLKTDSNVLKVEIIARDRWMKMEEEYYVMNDGSLESLYYNGVHECEHSWSIAGDKESCIHFNVLKTFHDLVDEVSSRRAELEDAGSDGNGISKDIDILDPGWIVLTNRRIEFIDSKLDIAGRKEIQRSLHYNLRYTEELSYSPGVTVSYLRPTIPPGFIKYILCNFSLRIKFIQVHCRSFRERQQSINSSILSMVDYKGRAVVVITPDTVDMKATARELKTRMFLSNMSFGIQEGVSVMYGTPPTTINGIFVTTFDKASCIVDNPLVVFKGCSNLGGYFPIFEVLRICDGREAFIYENLDYIEYVNSCLLRTGA